MRQEGSPAVLARQLARAGHLAPAWRGPFARVDRKLFLPDRVWIRDVGGEYGEYGEEGTNGEGGVDGEEGANGEGGVDDEEGMDGVHGYRAVDRATDPAGWHALAYEDRALVTQVEASPADGNTARVPSSSASMPRVVARMLDALAVTDGTTVLEIGTGTGYNAALLSERLGDRNVVTVEVDARIADTARANLKDAGHTPTVVTGDGSLGCPTYAPYDRIIVTCALHTVPYPLVEQTAPGGALVLPWGTGLYNGVLLRLTASGDGTASGPVIGDSAFMWNRYETPHRDVMATVRARPRSTGATATTLDPRHVFGHEDAAFTAGVLVPDCRYSVGHGPGGEFTLWLADHATGSWASVDYVPDGRPAHGLQQHGPRALWHEVEAAYAWWQEAGSPERTRYGLTVTPAGQHLWLDAPDARVRRRT
ncbi:methyltransferase domain-containing protein [Streptomyces corynorhini]|uniref:Protein-L-isoaspartate O-methyltransferase n=1 Tax=Streptomyces corynorhini TaxID=2282652 RepID=A0A370B170_9ACTN|nr:methyltransferase domain-containing protein [Streptomyces corynorhini]RDG35570.1 methyltransferase domain-containing protein [Streptomyces corynorhini]